MSPSAQLSAQERQILRTPYLNSRTRQGRFRLLEHRSAKHFSAYCGQPAASLLQPIWLLCGLFFGKYPVLPPGSQDDQYTKTEKASSSNSPTKMLYVVTPTTLGPSKPSATAFTIVPLNCAADAFTNRSV